MKKKIIALFLFLLALCIVGCKDKKNNLNTDNSIIEYDEKLVKEEFKDCDFTSYDNVYSRISKYWALEEGCYYLNFDLFNLMYYDKETDKTMYLCNKPDCTHGTKGCNAYYGSSISNVDELVVDIFTYADRLFVTTYEFTEETNCNMYISDLDGTNRRMIFSKSNSGIESCYICDGKFFFTMVEYVKDKDINYQNTMMYSINLSTGELEKEYECIPDEQHAMNYLVIIPSDSGGFYLCRNYKAEMLDGNAYLESLLEKPEYAGLDEDEKYDKAFEEYVIYNTSLNRTDFYSYDIESGKMTEAFSDVTSVNESTIKLVNKNNLYSVVEMYDESDRQYFDIYRNNDLVLKIYEAYSISNFDNYMCFSVMDGETETLKRMIYDVSADALYESKLSIEDGASEIFTINASEGVLSYNSNTVYETGMLSQDDRIIAIMSIEDFIDENYELYKEGNSNIQYNK